MSATDYGADVFGREDFTGLVAQLAERFVLSVNDVPHALEVRADLDIESVELTYTIAGGEGTSAKEIIATSKGLPREAATIGMLN